MKTVLHSVKAKFAKFLPSGLTIPDEWQVPGYSERNEYTPEIDQNYTFDHEVFRDLLNWYISFSNDGLFMFGPPGCGKTSAITQLCALLNIPLYEKTVFKRMRFEELVARPQILAGSSITLYGQLSKAMGAEGMPGILLLNEIDHAQEGVVTGMNEVLQGAPLDLAGLEVLKPEPGFRVVATANTGMMGDSSGLFKGAVRQNLAFIDRFWQVSCKYPDPEVELKILLSKAPQTPKPLARAMIDVANDVRSVFMGTSDSNESLEVTISTRGLLRWAKIAVTYANAEKSGINPIKYALDRAVLNVASPETRRAIHKIVDDRFDIQDASATTAQAVAA